MTPDYLDPVDLAAEIEGVKKSCFNAHDRYTCLWNGLAEIEHEFVKQLGARGGMEESEDSYIDALIQATEGARLLVRARQELEEQ